MNKTFALIGYFTSWSVYNRGYRVDKLPADELTHVNYAFANIKGGIPVLGDSWADVNMKSGKEKVPIHYYRGKPYPKAIVVEAPINESQPNTLALEPKSSTFTTISVSSSISLSLNSTSTTVSSDDNTTMATSIKASPSPVPLKGNLGALLELKKKHPHLKTLLSIGGWTWSAAFKGVSNTTEVRKKFSLGTKQLLTQYHFDGVDIDWEYPANQKEHLDFVLLLKELRSALGNNTLISVALPCGDERRGFRAKEIGEVVDFMNLMAYDFSIAGVSILGDHQSNLFHRNNAQQYSVDFCVQDYLKLGAPSIKIIMGVPFYGRSFSGIHQHKPPMSYEGAGRGSFEKGFINYRDIDRRKVEWEEECKAAYVITNEMVDKTVISTQLITITTHSVLTKTFTITTDSKMDSKISSLSESLKVLNSLSELIPIKNTTIQMKSMEPTLASSTTIDSKKTLEATLVTRVSTKFITSTFKELQTQVIFFDDERALQAKADYVKQHGLGGMMFWDASGDTDDHQFIKQLHQQLSFT